MVEGWLIEFALSIGRFFLYPLIYWAIILILVIGYRRIKRERNHFGIKIFDLFSEWKNMLGLSLLFGLLYSIIVIGAGVVIPKEVFWIMSIVTVVLSLSLSLNLLSPIYILGITYFVLLFVPLFNIEGLSFGNIDNFTFVGLAILLSMLLFFEAMMLTRVQENETFPALRKSRRGNWIGVHQIKKLSILPMFMIVPTGFIIPFADYWPIIPVTGQNYGLTLFPFIIGLQLTVKGNTPIVAAKKVTNRLVILSIIILLLAVGSYFISWLSFAAIIIAILGREYIHYRHRAEDEDQMPYFVRKDQGIQILSIIPDTPADDLELIPGEIITKVNDQKVTNATEFYNGLQQSGAYFKLEVLDDDNEIRFVQRAFYEGEHHNLGIIFIDKPYRM